MASGAKKKGTGRDESKKASGEHFMESIRSQFSGEDNQQFLEQLQDLLPDQEDKKLVDGWKKADKQRQETKHAAEVEMKKRLKSRTLEEFQKKSYDEGDQSPLVGKDAWILQSQWSHRMDYTPINPFSPWMKAVYTGNYEGMIYILHNAPDVKKLLSMRESLMNIPALLHVVMGARTIHSEEPSLVLEKLQIQRVLEVKYDHLKILEKLIELGADLSVKDVAGKGFLHYCFSGEGNPTTRAMAEMVLKAGLDPNIQDRFGNTPLLSCTLQNNLADIELLLKYGADPGIKDFEFGDSCFEVAQCYPAANKLIDKYMKKDLLKEREKLKEREGGSLKKCFECGKEKAERCKGCFVARYCSKDCQRAGWKTHKAECKATRARYRDAIVFLDSPFLSYIPPKNSVVDDPNSPPVGSFVVKVQVLNEGDLGEVKLPILIYNRDRTLAAALEREKGQEELYDKLERQVREHGFKGHNGFFPAIYKKESAGSEWCRVEINPDQMLPMEPW